MTDPSLRDYVDMRLSELEKRLADRFAAHDLAMNKAEADVRERLASMNQFRNALSDQAKNFVTRAEHDRLDLAIQSLRIEKANMDGRIAMFAVAVSVVVSFVMSGVLLVVSHFWPDVPSGK